MAAAASILLSDDDQGVPDRWQRGMNLTAFLPDAYGEIPARRSLVTAGAVGTELVSLTPTWYQDDSGSSEIFRDPVKTPTDESVTAVAIGARGLGLRVVIKPHLDVLDGSFRGEIQPLDREAWLASYREMLMGYADLAARVDAEALVVGTELTSMSLEPEPWREMIAAVRDRYGGQLTFAANWVEGAEQVQFWDDLDLIGIDAYMPLQTGELQPSVEQLTTAWEPYVERMSSLAEGWGRSVLFTELGYESRVGTATQASGPAAGSVDEDAEEAQDPLAGEQAQADAYEAAFEALSDQSWFEGIWWWEWSAEGLSPASDGFSPEGKLAADVLTDWQQPPE